jgi:hypothetical protein
VGFLDHLGYVQKGFARNAPSQETCSSEFWLGLDNNDLLPFIGRKESRRISARTTT